MSRSLTLNEAGEGPVRRSADRAWTPARWYMVVFAVVHIPLGIAGLVVDRSFPIGPQAARQGGSGFIFGVLETNGWHSLAALGLGLIAGRLAIRARGARRVALEIGVLHVGLFLSLVLWEPSTFSLASNAADQVVHASSALGGIAAGLATRRWEPAAAAS